MLQSSSLRIGNYVRNEDGTICPITSLHKLEGNQIAVTGACRPAGSKFGGYVESFDAIPLTEEIILRCGFTVDNGNTLPGQKSYTRNGILLSSRFQLCTNNTAIAIIGNPLESLHQLQNLYYALTADELTMELEATNS